MGTISEFTPEVCEKLGYYVYRLVDPRNGKTFYVGKGKNNRVFAHVKMVLKDTNDVDYNPKNDYEDNLKYKTIKEINEAGLEVIHIIQKHGLSERDAFLIESVLIESYSVDIKLTNKIKGFDTTEPENAITLQRNLCAEEYKDSKDNPKYMIIKVKQYWLEQRANRYETTRSSWKLNIATAAKYPYVLSVTNGIVQAAYKVNEWHYLDDLSGRAEFTGVEAEKEVADIFLNKRIPAKYRKKGQASPCLYCKPDTDSKDEEIGD